MARLFAISDLHVDYRDNAAWIEALSEQDYQDDLLIVAGDVSHDIKRVADAFVTLKARFREVFFVPGNHDVWVRGEEGVSSFEKFQKVCSTAQAHGVRIERYERRGLVITPLFGWYDGSFGEPTQELRERWMDYFRCDWGDRSDAEVTDRFLEMNGAQISARPSHDDGATSVSFSHFLPRTDVMPLPYAGVRKLLRPVLGAERLDAHVEAVGSQIHIYGHSHLNRHVRRGGRLYVNNALGAPSETHICARELRCIWED